MYSAGFILNSWQVVKPTFLLYVPPYHYAVLTVVYLGPKMYIFFSFLKNFKLLSQKSSEKWLHILCMTFPYSYSPLCTNHQHQNWESQKKKCQLGWLLLVKAILVRTWHGYECHNLQRVGYEQNNTVFLVMDQVLELFKNIFNN